MTTESEPLEPKLIRLFVGDFARLTDLYPSMSTARIIRQLVRAHIRRVEEAAAQGLSAPPVVEVELEKVIQ